MPTFAPNIYKIVDGKQVYSGKPDMSRVWEVDDERAEQVFRQQSQWIEVFIEKKKDEEVVANEETTESIKKKPGRPRKEK